MTKQEQVKKIKDILVITELESAVVDDDCDVAKVAEEQAVAIYTQIVEPLEKALEAWGKRVEVESEMKVENFNRAKKAEAELAVYKKALELAVVRVDCNYCCQNECPKTCIELFLEQARKEVEQ